MAVSLRSPTPRSKSAAVRFAASLASPAGFAIERTRSLAKAPDVGDSAREDEVGMKDVADVVARETEGRIRALNRVARALGKTWSCEVEDA